MTEARGQQNIDDIFHQLNDKAKKVYRFVTVYHDILHFPRDYGTGQPINMVEVHTLTDIAERPGTTVTQLAQYWNRTPSAICQTVKKLEA